MDATRYRGMGVARMDRKGHSSDFDGLQLLSHWAAKPRCKNIHRSRGKALARMWRLVTGSKEIFDISQGKKGGSARPTLGIPCKSIHPCPRATSLAKRCRLGPNKRVGSRPKIWRESENNFQSLRMGKIPRRHHDHSDSPRSPLVGSDPVGWFCVGGHHPTREGPNRQLNSIRDPFLGGPGALSTACANDFHMTIMSKLPHDLRRFVRLVGRHIPFLHSCICI